MELLSLFPSQCPNFIVYISYNKEGYFIKIILPCWVSSLKWLWPHVVLCTARNFRISFAGLQKENRWEKRKLNQSINQLINSRPPITAINVLRIFWNCIKLITFSYLADYMITQNIHLPFLEEYYLNKSIWGKVDHMTCFDQTDAIRNLDHFWKTWRAIICLFSLCPESRSAPDRGRPFSHHAKIKIYLCRATAVLG